MSENKRNNNGMMTDFENQFAFICEDELVTHHFQFV